MGRAEPRWEQCEGEAAGGEAASRPAAEAAALGEGSACVGDLDLQSQIDNLRMEVRACLRVCACARAQA